MTNPDHQSIPSFPIEEVARYPLPGAAYPGALAFSPDDKLVTYLFSPDGGLVRHLYAFDVKTGDERLLVSPPDGGASEENLPLEEKLRRERLRQVEIGVTDYAWAKEGGRILVPLPDGLYVADGPDAPLEKILAADRPPAQDPRFSPDGRWVAYVQDAELNVVPSAGGQPHQLTHEARGTGKTNGLADFIAQEEMRRPHGYWWSGDSQWIAFVEVDETHIPIYRIMHQGKDTVGEGAQEDHRYPFAGEANARIRLGVISVAGSEPVWMDLGPEEDIYLARVDWLPGGRLAAQIENREQTRLDLVVFDPATGEGQSYIHETSQVWINLHDMFKPLKKAREDGGAFIWASERTGFMHLYLYNGQGELIRPLTQGQWVVDALAGVDEKRGLVYFAASLDGPTESHLYVVPLGGGEPRRITVEPGFHTVELDHGFERFLDTHHSLESPPSVTLRSLIGGAELASGVELAAIYDQVDPRIKTLDLQPPEIVSLENSDGVTLYGTLYRPPAEFGDGPHPTILHVYGGPWVQLVTNSWRPTIAMRAQYLSRLGFLVFTLDNRGSARRGLDFESAIKHNTGDVEVRDQVDGLRWLVDQGLADPERVGIYGWSYGGYMAAMCLAKVPEVFKAAVAGAPATHYDGYDTHYTERYMGTPQSNPDGYERSSVLAHVAGIRGKLLIIHGLIDENVHFRHTARLVNALIAARAPYELFLFPDERHLPRQEGDRIYMEERIRDFFMENL
jgi:dipeptidyl-peptidase-4